MSNLSEDELLEWAENTLKGWRTTELSHVKALSNPNLVKAIKSDIEHLEQIVALIKQAKKEVTEEWIEEKAKEAMSREYGAVGYTLHEWKDFIHSLVEEAVGK